MTQQSHFWVSTQENSKIFIHKGICSPMFIVALFMVPKTWKQPKCPSIGDWIKNMWEIYIYIYGYIWIYINGVILSHEKKWNVVIYDMDGPWEYYVKWNKCQKKLRTIWFHWNVWYIVKLTLIDAPISMVVTKRRGVGWL